MSVSLFAPERIFLVGLPGAGKTTLGCALASALDWPFLDLDAEIERAAGRSISVIFEDDGEEAFRTQEAAVLRHVGLAAPLVLATGGGTPCAHDSMDWLLAHGSVVWLDVAPAVIARRLALAPVVPVGNRPLLVAAAAASPQATESLLFALLGQTLEARAPFYGRAPHRLTGADLTADVLRSLLGL